MGTTDLIVIIITSLIVILFPIKVVTIFTTYYCDKKKIYSMSSSKSINFAHSNYKRWYQDYHGLKGVCPTSKAASPYLIFVTRATRILV